MAHSKLIDVDIRVRGYEIDSLGHVNNAVYLSWLEHARWELFGAHALPPLPPGVAVVVRHLELDFRYPVVLGDTVQVTQWPRSIGRTSVVLGARMQIVQSAQKNRIGQIALVAKQVIACVQLGEGKAPVPEIWRDYFPPDDPGDNPDL